MSVAAKLPPVRRARPTMQDVAALAGVSVKTVSRVVNGEPAIAPGTASRVTGAIEHLGFLRNDLARSLRSKDGSRMVGLIIEDLANPFYSGIAKGIEEEATARGYMAVISSSEEDPAREKELIGALCARRVEGIVLVPAAHSHRYLLPQIESGLRLVFLDRPPRHVRADTLLLDNRGASRAATEVLISEGHTRIAAVTPSADLYAVGERLRGYREALQRAGLTPDPALECVGAHTADQGEAAADALLQAERPTAIFCGNNRTAIGVVRAVVRAGADVAIVGYDDFELADLLPIRIRVLRHDPVELGRKAMRMLFSRIDGNEAVTRSVARPELVWRGVTW